MPPPHRQARRSGRSGRERCKDRWDQPCKLQRITPARSEPAGIPRRFPILADLPATPACSQTTRPEQTPDRHVIVTFWWWLRRFAARISRFGERYELSSPPLPSRNRRGIRGLGDQWLHAGRGPWHDTGRGCGCLWRTGCRSCRNSRSAARFLLSHPVPTGRLDERRRQGAGQCRRHGLLRPWQWQVGPGSQSRTQPGRR